MNITATDFKSNLGKYLSLASTEDVFISINGKLVAKLCNPYQDRVNLANSLIGVVSPNITIEKAREERLSKI